MVDRHDIDALLIGSLYGELSSADEARLKAHLEAHPTDRAALEGLTHTRDAVRASRLFEVQLEPPQSVSALLMQEAVRRAPRKADAAAGEGWFARLRRSFLMHPAMAAAAMMVLVVGAAGTLYLRKSDHFAAPELAAPQGAAERRTPDTAATPAAPPAPSGATTPDPVATATPTGQAQGAAEPAADSAAFGKQTRDSAKYEPAPARDAKAKSERLDRADRSYRVGLADEEAGGGRAEQQAKPADTAPAIAPDTAPAKPSPPPPPAWAKPAAEKANAPRSAGPGALLEVTTPRPAPKELDDDDSRPKKTAKSRAQSDEPRTEAAPPADPSIGAKRGMAPVVRAPEAAPATPAATAVPPMKTPAGGGAAGGAPATGGLADAKSDVADPDLAWARDQHSRLVTQVRAGRCTDAAGTAVALSSRAPGYYQQNVENDRAVKECLAYINAERERAVERTQRTGGTRRPSEEAAAPKQATRSKSAPVAKPAAAKPAAADTGKSAPAKAKAEPATTKTD